MIWNGLVQGLKLTGLANVLSTLHSKVVPALVLVEVKVNVGVFELDGLVGLLVMVVSNRSIVIEFPVPAVNASTTGVVIGLAPVWLEDFNATLVPKVPLTLRGAVIL